ncbi:MAG: hypothetical protein IH872_08660 [Chloroflexi bacterium]|nr:hypothetical protein [Chloroflexota bacterium]
MTEIKEFEFLRDDWFFNQMVTFSLAVTGVRAITKPEDLKESPQGRIKMSLGGIILQGLVCGSVLRVLPIARAIEKGRAVDRIEFEEDSFSHGSPTPPTDTDINGYMTDVASVCTIAAYQSVEGRIRARWGNAHRGWPLEVQYLRLLRHAVAHGNKFTIRKSPDGSTGINPKTPPTWRSSNMTSDDEMDGKQLFNEFLMPGDIPVLLSDIRQVLGKRP